MEQKGFKKHHFWILLGLAVLLIPITLGGAVFGVGGAAADKSKSIESELKAINSQQVKSDDYREQLEAQKAEIQRQKTRVWKSAYEAQEGLIHWPAALSYLNKLYFGDPVDAPDRAVFMKNDVYGAEYEQLPDIIYPTFFPDYNWRQVLTRYPEFKKLPTTEETWLALEDLCIQREVLRDVDAVNRMLAEFLPDPMPPKVPAQPKGNAPEEKQRYQDEKARYTKSKEVFDDAKRKVDGELQSELKCQPGEFSGRFISPYWRLDLVVGRPSGGRAGELSFRGKLTNTSGRRLTVGRIDFKVWLRNPANGTNVEYVLLPIETERGYLEAGESFPNKERDGKDFFTVTRTGQGESTLHVYKIEQKLDARFAPVKRVDKLELGYKSQRFASKQLAKAAISEEEEKKDPQTTAAATLGPNSGAPLPGGLGGGAGAGFTPNGIPRERYLERTEQVRRMPVGVVLIVDQAHVQDVLRAFANSRLRFQNTQYHLSRFRDVISLDSPDMSTGAAPNPGAGTPAVPTGPGAVPPAVADVLAGRMKRGGPGGKRGMGEEFRPGGPGGPGGRRVGRPPPTPGSVDPGSGSAEEENNTLVELTVYGLISLYERFPPKAATAAPTPGMPPGTPPPAAAAPPPPPAVPSAPAPPPVPTGGALPPPTPPGPNPTGGPAKPPG